jgi:hypothetical protein
VRVLCGVYICAAEFARLQATACRSGVGGESAGLRRSVRGAVGLSLCGAGFTLSLSLAVTRVFGKWVHVITTTDWCDAFPVCVRSSCWPSPVTCSCGIILCAALPKGCFGTIWSALHAKLHAALGRRLLGVCGLVEGGG